MTDEIKDDAKPVETAYATQIDVPVKTPLFMWVIGGIGYAIIIISAVYGLIHMFWHVIIVSNQKKD